MLLINWKPNIFTNYEVTMKSKTQNILVISLLEIKACNVLQWQSLRSQRRALAEALYLNTRAMLSNTS